MDHLSGLTLFDCSNELELLKCRTCPNFQTNFLVSLRRSSISGHNEDNSSANKVYKCLGCPFETSSRYLHLRHRLFRECATVTEDKNFVCYKDGGTTFTLKKEAIDSQRQNWKDIDLCKPESRIIRSSMWNCGQCQYKTKRKSNLKTHIMYRHSRPEDIHWFKCDQCSLKFKEKGCLKRHITCRHSKPKDIQWLKCGQCPSKFKRKSQLKVHTLYHHSKPEDTLCFKCDQCHGKFKLKANLTKHVKEQHSNPEDLHWIKCDHCSHKFKRKQHLQTHVTAFHTKPEDIEWLKCDECGSEFKHKRSLNRHTKSKHS